jgi:hypothetical protein
VRRVLMRSVGAAGVLARSGWLDRQRWSKGPPVRNRRRTRRATSWTGSPTSGVATAGRRCVRRAARSTKAMPGISYRAAWSGARDPGVGCRSSDHVRHADGPLVRTRPRRARKGTVSSSPRQAAVSSWPAVVVSGSPCRNRFPNRGAAVRRLLRLHGARGLAVARAGAVASLHDRAAA